MASELSGFCFIRRLSHAKFQGFLAILAVSLLPSAFAIAVRFGCVFIVRVLVLILPQPGCLPLIADLIVLMDPDHESDFEGGLYSDRYTSHPPFHIDSNIGKSGYGWSYSLFCKGGSLRGKDDSATKSAKGRKVQFSKEGPVELVERLLCQKAHKTLELTENFQQMSTAWWIVRL